MYRQSQKLTILRMISSKWFCIYWRENKWPLKTCKSQLFCMHSLRVATCTLYPLTKCEDSLDYKNGYLGLSVKNPKVMPPSATEMNLCPHQQNVQTTSTIMLCIRGFTLTKDFRIIHPLNGSSTSASSIYSYISKLNLFYFLFFFLYHWSAC